MEKIKVIKVAVITAITIGLVILAYNYYVLSKDVKRQKDQILSNTVWKAGIQAQAEAAGISFEEQLNIAVKTIVSSSHKGNPFLSFF